nr:hypothetical protein GCM10025732_29420 [Glycomyces mayteni]
MAAVLAARELIVLWGHADTIYTALFQGVVVGAATAVVYLGIGALIGGSGVVRPVLRRAGRIRSSTEDEAHQPDEDGADQ